MPKLLISETLLKYCNSELSKQIECIGFADQPIRIIHHFFVFQAKMGYQQGSGLGKHGQGRKEIVEASTQRGRRGLGHKIEGFEPSDVEWDFEKEKVMS